MMYKSYCVVADSRSVSMVEFVSEDGTNYAIPMKAMKNENGDEVGYADWSGAGDHRRVLKSGDVCAVSGERQGRVGEWLLCNGVHEFWTTDESIANAVVASVKLGKTLSPATHHYRDYYMM
ncbi:MAG: hypothetical protein RDU25_05415 [Patescibacteria group bacterium]|nr:hypothetical protein [Patescibacteria group bacterium]